MQILPSILTKKMRDRTQFAALPFRIATTGQPEIMLLTSRDTGRWVVAQSASETLPCGRLSKVHRIGTPAVWRLIWPYVTWGTFGVSRSGASAPVQADAT
jgi:hypothetical protein